jgi:hypothetical protein
MRFSIFSLSAAAVLLREKEMEVKKVSRKIQAMAIFVKS